MRPPEEIAGSLAEAAVELLLAGNTQAEVERLTGLSRYHVGILSRRARGKHPSLAAARRAAAFAAEPDARFGGRHPRGT